MPAERRTVYLDRRTCIIEPERIDVRPARAAAVLPLSGVLLGLASFAAIPLFMDTLPYAGLVLLLFFTLISLPLSGIGLVYVLAGASVTADRRGQAVVWQQGFLGMGVGTRELVPFENVERWVVEETTTSRGRGDRDDIARYEVSLEDTGGRRLPVATATMPRSLAREALGRARSLGEALAAVSGKPLSLPPERRSRRGRRLPGAPVERAAT